MRQFMGRGGWGEVWRAVTDEGRSVALKFLPCDQTLSAPFEIRALQALRCLDHPHLLKMEQIWSCPGYLVIVMELAEGNLLDLLDLYCTELDTMITPDHVCWFLSKAASAIDYMNERRHLIDGQKVAFRHCDIKPSNILVVGGKVKVGDFSLSFKTGARIGPHARTGTYQYAAPEVFSGLISDRSDQFSLAVTYHQLRTGALPFPPPPTPLPRDYVRDTPDLSALTPTEQVILARGLSPIWQDRWPTCVEMMDRLTACFPKKSVA
jgi:serine/threonine protein kinase